MKATYKNAVRSKEMIKKALIELISAKHNINEITVSDIVKKADINRGTFYNHYNNVTEVFEELKDEMIKSLSDGLKDSKDNKDISLYIHALVRDFKQKETLYRKLIEVIPRDIIDDIKFKFIDQILYIKPDIDKATLYFLVNGVSGMYLDFMEGKIAGSFEELGEKSIAMIKDILKDD